MEISFTVDGPPVAWGRAGLSGKRHFTPKKTSNYENAIKQMAAIEMKGAPPVDHPVVVDVAVFIQPPKSLSKRKMARALAGGLRPGTRPDIDNYLKAALDGMNRIVFRDDALVVTVMAGKFYSERPRLEIRAYSVMEA